MKKINLTIVLFCLAPSLWGQVQKEIRPQINLHGIWQFALDPNGTGIKQNFQQKIFSETITLPGTTDVNKKGNLNTQKDVTTQLSRIYSYVGKAWYKKDVYIPETWQDKNISLILERTKPTQVWIDGKAAGENTNISTMQVYDLTHFLPPGKHQLAVMVDNGASVPPQLLENSHAYSESTQTNWNGIIGQIYLEASNQLHIADVRVYPDVKKKSVKVNVKISSPDKIIQGTKITLSARAWNVNVSRNLTPISYALVTSKGEYEFEYYLGDKALLWSEFHPALYKLEVAIAGYDKQYVNFGLRNFTVDGTQFAINSQKTFLRGKHDGCVFPLTAHTAMDLGTWRHYFQVAKSYGINHYRFHSWCPPKACFDAADIEGVYLQPELPIWGSLKKDDEFLISYLRKEGINIQNEYGNHASFVMFSLGNELSGDVEVMKSLASAFRQTDNRRLYTFGSNNYLGFNGLIPGEDYLVTCRIGKEEANSFNTHTRGSFSFADAYDGGYINHTYPNSVMDFSSGIAGCNVPVVSHETGQFQVYPDYKEIAKYTGVLYPYNMEIFRQRLEKAGMLSQAEDFFLASGKWAVELYKADIEMDLRTPGFGGFQLLDLQDYPGQGSAYVGILDAFMDSKGLICPEKWKQFCSETVPLFVTEKFCWTNSEHLTGRVKIANYSEKSMGDKVVVWKLTDQQDHILDSGNLKVLSKSTGLIDIGDITPRISSISKAQRLNLNISITGTPYNNSYALWVYPKENEIKVPNEITVTDTLGQKILEKLKKGEKILWFPKRKQYEKMTVGGLFQTDYWNYRMFKTISESNKQPVSPGTLGILTDPGHPLFNDFPTDFHTNWQWFSIIKQSYPLVLDRLPAGYKPIVQVIDNVERNHKLGLIFEFTVEKGKLLICMSDLEAVKDKPEVRQLYNSMLKYMMSDQFKPTAHLDINSLTDLLSTEVTSNRIQVLKNISYQ
jgi:hypothetical protein